MKCGKNETFERVVGLVSALLLLGLSVIVCVVILDLASLLFISLFKLPYYMESSHLINE